MKRFNSEEKVTFEIKQYFDDQGYMKKGIFVDGELFDWGVDEENLKDAMEMGPQYVALIQKSIEDHFLESLSEFMGRRVTAEEVNVATRTGVISKYGN